MKPIQPIATTTTATQLQLTLIYDNLVDTAHVTYKLLTADGAVIRVNDGAYDNIIVIDGADYQSWGASGEDVNEQIYDIVMAKLNITPATP